MPRMIFARRWMPGPAPRAGPGRRRGPRSRPSASASAAALRSLSASASVFMSLSRLSAKSCGRSAISAIAARVSSAALGQRFDLGRGALRAFLPLRLLGDDRLQPLGAVLGLALDAVMAGARFAIDGALAIDACRAGLRSPASGRRARQFGELGFGRVEARLGFGKAGLDAPLGFIERARLLQALGDLPFMLAQARGAPLRPPMWRRARLRGGRARRARRFRRRCARYRRASWRFCHGRLRFCRLGFERRQAGCARRAAWPRRLAHRRRP